MGSPGHRVKKEYFDRPGYLKCYNIPLVSNLENKK